MGLLDTYFSVILIDAAEALPIGIWIMKTFYDTINKELEEAVIFFRKYLIKSFNIAGVNG